MASQWFYKHEGEKFGPVSTEQLKSLAAAMRISPADSIWKDGMAEWASAVQLKGLFKDQVNDRTKPASSRAPLVTVQGETNFRKLWANVAAVEKSVRRRLKLTGKIVAKQITRTKLSIVTLPRAHKSLGSYIAKTEQFRDEFPDLFQQHAVSSALASVKLDLRFLYYKCRVAKSMEKLGRDSFERNGQQSGPVDVIRPIVETNLKIASLAAEIGRIVRSITLPCPPIPATTTEAEPHGTVLAGTPQESGINGRPGCHSDAVAASDKFVPVDCSVKSNVTVAETWLHVEDHFSSELKRDEELMPSSFHATTRKSAATSYLEREVDRKAAPIYRIGSGFTYGFSGLRSYSGAVLIDDQQIYLIVGTNRILASEGSIDRSFSQFLLKLALTAAVKVVIHTTGRRLKHPFEISFSELPGYLRGFNGLEDAASGSKVIAIPHSAIILVQPSKWLGCSHVINTNKASFQLTSSKQEMQTAAVIFSGTEWRHSRIARCEPNKPCSKEGHKPLESATAWQNSMSLGTEDRTQKSRIEPPPIPYLQTGPKSDGQRGYPSLDKPVPPLPLGIRHIAEAVTASRGSFSPIAIILYLVGLFAVALYWFAAVVAGLAAAKDYRIVPAVLVIGVPIVAMYGLVRCFNFHALGIGFTSGLAALGFLSISGTVLSLCGVAENAIFWTCWPLTLLILCLVTWRQVRYVRPGKS